MKCIILLACLACVAYGDLICFIGGNYACKINCIASGLLHGGQCHEDGDCKCITETGGEVAPKPKAELVCLLGGDLACEINCLTSAGHFLGHCTEAKDCVCEARPSEPS
uniref:Invertebrate defensins family profile domain-containing protein n=1 Tax=Strigamia maritima TaxID=126957 RepID=T1ISR3_STRMM